MCNKQNILAIDPGLSLGWAYFPADSDMPTMSGIIKPAYKKRDYFEKLRSTVRQFDALLEELLPHLDIVGIEWPTIHSSVKGRAAAGSGSVVKLAFEVGKLAQVAEDNGVAFEKIDIIKWKGQLKKPIVIKRIKEIITRRLLNLLTPEDDTWDALGIGLYMRGLF